ncbi:hypothetical protein KCU71_g126, partial [Aureobasidium melanogenum]
LVHVCGRAVEVGLESGLRMGLEQHRRDVSHYHYNEVPLQLKNTNQQTPYTPHFYPHQPEAYRHCEYQSFWTLQVVPEMQVWAAVPLLEPEEAAEVAGAAASEVLTTVDKVVAGLEVTAAAAEVLTGTLDETAEVAGLDDAAAAEVAGAALPAPQLMTAGPGALDISFEVEGAKEPDPVTLICAQDW